jgi:antitoxin ParD1/3/4
MRTNIDIDDQLMTQAMSAGPFKTKKDAVEAGLKLLARQAAYREIIKWRGKLKWEGDESIDWTAGQPPAAVLVAAEPPPPPYRAGGTKPAVSKRRARR